MHDAGSASNSHFSVLTLAVEEVSALSMYARVLMTFG